MFKFPNFVNRTHFAAMQSQLEDIRRAFELQTERVKQFRLRFSKEDWLRKPGPERWSAIECIEHLNLTAEAFLPRLSAAIGKAGVLTADRQFHLDFVGFMLVKVLSSRKKFSRSKTTAPFVPAKSPDVARTLEHFFELQDGLLRSVQQSERKAIDTVKVQSAFHARVRYHVFSAFRALVAHEVRHLDQAERASSER